MKACWLLKHIFSCLATLLEVVLRVIYPIVKPAVLNPTNRKTLFKSTHASTSLRVNFPSSGSVKKFTGAYFFTYTHARLNISNKIFITKPCQYLNSEISLQWTVCSPNVFKHALRQTRNMMYIWSMMWQMIFELALNKLVMN